MERCCTQSYLQPLPVRIVNPAHVRTVEYYVNRKLAEVMMLAVLRCAAQHPRIQAARWFIVRVEPERLVLIRRGIYICYTLSRRTLAALHVIGHLYRIGGVRL